MNNYKLFKSRVLSLLFKVKYVKKFFIFLRLIYKYKFVFIKILKCFVV